MHLGYETIPSSFIQTFKKRGSYPWSHEHITLNNAQIMGLLSTDVWGPERTKVSDGLWGNLQLFWLLVIFVQASKLSLILAQRWCKKQINAHLRLTETWMTYLHPVMCAKICSYFCFSIIKIDTYWWALRFPVILISTEMSNMVDIFVLEIRKEDIYLL